MVLNVNKPNEVNSINAKIYGKSDHHIDFASLECPVHRDILEAIQLLKTAASEAGFCLKLASGFRNFDRQCAIWNAKVQGLRPVLDNKEQPINLNALSEAEKVFAILRWSALPGTSRHHWGTDFDVFDAGALEDEKLLQLTVKETQEGGPFFNFYQWLDEHLKEKKCKFFRPYGKDLGGVSPEPWHLSYQPVAELFESAFALEELKKILESSDILLKDTVIENLDEIYQRFVVNTSKA